MYLGKEVRIFLKGQAKDGYLELKKRNDKESRSILNSIERVKGILKDNPQFGDPIAKKLIPKSLIDLGIQNLYRVELSNYWRMLYTIFCCIGFAKTPSVFPCSSKLNFQLCSVGCLFAEENSTSLNSDVHFNRYGAKFIDGARSLKRNLYILL